MTRSAMIVLYASLGEELRQYRLDLQAATLSLLATTKLSVNVQFATANPARSHLYVVSSNAGSGTLGAKGDTHLLSAFQIDPATGTLTAIGEPVPLAERPIHLSVDQTGQYALVAYNQSGTLSVHGINGDGAIGGPIEQPQPIDAGIFTHQVVVTPGNQTVLALGRGNDAIQDRAEEPGSISTFAFDQGILRPLSQTILEAGIGPRHLAYHPTRPWVYVGIERGSKLFMYHLREDGTLDARPSFMKEALKDMANEHRLGQKGGVVQVSPDGNYLYVANRADHSQQEGDKAVLVGGENNIAVFSLDQQTGEPTLVQHLDPRGIEARTFNTDPTGKLFVVANQKSLWVREGGGLSLLRANLALFRVAQDGKLQLVRQYEMEDTRKWLLWMDIYAVGV